MVELPRLVWVFVAGIALLIIGLAITASAPSSGGEVLVLVGLVLLAALPFVVAWRGLRSPDWSNVWNPGAAYRAARAEREDLDGAPGPASGLAQRVGGSRTMRAGTRRALVLGVILVLVAVFALYYLGASTGVR